MVHNCLTPAISLVDYLVCTKAETILNTNIHMNIDRVVIVEYSISTRHSISNCMLLFTCKYFL